MAMPAVAPAACTPVLISARRDTLKVFIAAFGNEETAYYEKHIAALNSMLPVIFAGNPFRLIVHPLLVAIGEWT